MTVQRAVLAFAGAVILAMVMLARLAHPAWIWGAAFVGANLLQSAFTGICPLASLLRKAGLRDGAAWTPRGGAAVSRRTARG